MATPGGPASKSALKWVQKEGPSMLEGLQMVVRSQLGYDIRQKEKECRYKCLQTVVGGGTKVDPSNPSASSNDFNLPQLPPLPKDLQRLEAVAAGLKAFAGLAAQLSNPFLSQLIVHACGEAAAVLHRGITDRTEQLLVVLESGGKLMPPSGLFGSIDVVPHGTIPMAAETNGAESDLTPEEEAFLLKAVRSVGDKAAEAELLSLHKKYEPTLPEGYRAKAVDILNRTDGHETKVPASRIARFASFGQLAMGLGAGAAAEVTRRVFRMSSSEGASERVIGADNLFLTEANANRIVATLCRVRGAALKLGQMLSIQDSDTVPQPLLDIFERVRHSADFMPKSQVNKQMTESFGPEWRSLLKEFDEKPFAAASIGQVHRARLLDGREVAVKIQYPGVAEGIDSDIDNLVSIMSIGGLFPKGMYLENFVKVARHELKAECDYEREARAGRQFRELLKDSKDFYVPEMIDSLSSSRVLTAELISGRPVDQCIDEDQRVRDWISAKFIQLCLKEIFEWRFMQTDPNWANFFFGRHPISGDNRLILLDFGATRSYGKPFVDLYMRILKAAYDKNDDEILKHSRSIGFLTGYESAVMEKAHCASTMILGETLASQEPFDFAKQNVTKRIHALIPVMLEHRLTSPPEEVYSLHRKLSGSYLLATKLKATVACGPIFRSIYDRYTFGNFDTAVEIDIDR
ncbi:coq-8, partial [Pristionchus pacificus]|uniref:Coq-8 n=1 Tax=Pristionchus pacificus TaxID=54126 RepID=A0A2A6CDJ2_PRIPA